MKANTHDKTVSTVLQITDYKRRLRAPKTIDTSGDCGPLNNIYFAAQELQNPVLRERIVGIVVTELSKYFGGAV